MAEFFIMTGAMIIGLTGPMGCGKGEIVKILEKMNFKYITLSMMVREEAQCRGVAEEREILMGVGNSMRKKFGAGILAIRAIETVKASGHDKWVIDGIRNPAEIDELKKENAVYIVGVTANRDLIVSRILDRNRESDAKNSDDILKKIKREWGEGEPNDGQQVGKCMKIVDYTIVNEGTLEDLENDFMKFYNSINK